MTEQESAVRAFERGWWRFAGTKEQAIREQLDMSPIRYYQLLNRLLDDPEALAADPLMVNRLRRVRAARMDARGLRGVG